MEINIENIKKDIKREFSNIFEKSKKYYYPIDLNDANNNLTSNVFPLHYLFDSYLNSKIPNNYQIVSEIRNDLKLDKLFSINSNEIIYVSVPEHATIFYKIIKNTNKYIYYSNSGLGTENHIFENSLQNGGGKGNINPNNETIPIAPKIYKIDDGDLFNKIPLYINYIIKNIAKSDINDRFKYKEILENINKYCKENNIENLQLVSDIFNNDFDKIMELIKENRITNLQNLVYALLNYCICKYPDNIQEVSFNHIVQHDLKIKKIILSILIIYFPIVLKQN